MSAVAKKWSEQPQVEPAGSPSAIEVDSLALFDEVESPARRLQEQLVAEWDGREEKFPARYVTATVAVVCLAAWFGAYMFYASL